MREITNAALSRKYFVAETNGFVSGKFRQTLPFSIKTTIPGLPFLCREGKNRSFLSKPCSAIRKDYPK